MLISVNNKDLYEISGYYDLSLLFQELNEVPKEEIELWVTTQCYSYKEGDDWKDHKDIFYMNLAMTAMRALREGYSFSFINAGRTSSLKKVTI